MYCAFVTLLPLVLIGLDKGYRPWIIGASVVMWAAVQNNYGSAIDGAPLYPLHVGSFNLFAWQLLFFGGVIIGRERALHPERTLVPFRWPIFLFVLAFAVYGWGIQHQGWHPFGWSDPTFGIMINKTALGLLRLADFGACAYLIAVLGGLCPKLLTWRPLAFLGQHSIAVFGVQSVVAVILLEFTWPFATPWRNYVTTFLALGCLWLSAWAHQAIRSRQTAKAPLSPRHDVRAA
jgi:hypothetical protein